MTRRLSVVAVLTAVLATSGCTAIGRTSDPACFPGPLSVSPKQVEPGDRVTVSAPASSCSIRFTDDRWYRLELAWSRWDVVTAARVRVAESGAFTTTLRVPSGAPAGRPTVAVISGYESRCPEAASCAGFAAELDVVRPRSVPVDLRGLQAQLDLAPTQRGRLWAWSDSSTCLTLDRPWTSDLDLALPAGWRLRARQVTDESGRVVARLDTDVRVEISSTRRHSGLPGCKTDRTVATVTAFASAAREGPPPPGGRLLVGTDSGLKPSTPGTSRSGVLRGERHRDHLCVSLDDDGRSVALAFPSGTTALPDGTLVDASGAEFAAVGQQVTAVVANEPVGTPAGCAGNARGLGVVRLG